MLKMTGALIAMPRNRAAQTNSQYLISMCHSQRPIETDKQTETYRQTERQTDKQPVLD